MNRPWNMWAIFVFHIRRFGNTLDTVTTLETTLLPVAPY
jgi:hypothetical protein